MPSSYTTSLRLTLPATGELAGQWGNTVNQGITELLDAAVAGTASISTWGGAGVAYTLSNNSGTADEARKMFIVATGTPGEAKNVICPAVSKFYVFRNDTTGGFALTLKTSGGTGIAVPAGQYKFLYCDGTNVVETFNSAGALTLSGALSVGGTTTLASNPTLSAGTANQVQYLNGSKVLVGSANMTFDGTSLTLGGNPVLSGGTANGVLYLNGSKVATSGSALTFDGTNLGAPAEVYRTTASSYLRLSGGDGAGSGASVLAFGQSHATNPNRLSLNAPNATATSYIDFSVAGAEGMRLTSTGLGIGTTPTRKLTIYGAGASGTSASNPSIRLDNNTTGRFGLYELSGDGNLYIWNSDTGAGSTVILRGAGSGTETARFDGSGNFGLGVTPSAWDSSAKAIQVGSFVGLSGFTDYMDLSTNSYYAASGYKYLNTGRAATTYAQTAGQHRWYTAPSGTAGNAISFTQAMTLDASGNLGIGTSSPGSKLDVSGANAGSVLSSRILNTSTSASSDAQQFIYVNSGTAGDPYTTWTVGGVSAWSAGIRNSDSDNWYLSPGSSLGTSPALTVTTSGNFGLGVTPSAFTSTIKALQIGPTSVFRAGDTAYTQATFVASNARQASAVDYYIANGYASQYGQQSGAHYWYTAPSGTAGNAISFTQAMTLDASGNLGVGSTSPVGVFEASSATPVITASQSNAAVTADMLLGAFNAYSYDSSTNSKGGVGGVRVFAGGTYNTGFTPSYLAFYTHDNVANNNTLLGAATERARITSGGYFKASNAGTYLNNSGSYHELRQSASAEYVVYLTNSHATNPFGFEINYTAADPNGTGNRFFGCYGATSTQRAEIRSNGGIANYQANDVNLSDRREKTNFAPAKSYLDTICAIPVQTFNYIDQSPDDPGLTLGVVAQDVQAVAPELVMESNWGTEDNPKMRLSIYQTDLQYALMKCVQELKAQNDELRARVAALEAQP